MKTQTVVGGSACALTVAAALLFSPSWSGTVASQTPAAAHPLLTEAQYLQWQKELSNWGRWGKDDEMGTLNLITPQKRKQAAALVKDGVAVSLSSAMYTEKGDDVPCPIEWSMLNASERGAADRVGFPCIHGAGVTHLDSFAHVFFGGKMWNGYPVKDLVTKEGGAGKASIVTMKDGIVTRGVYYDIPRLKGLPYLEPGTRIFPEDLEAWEKKTGVKAGPGDVMLVGWGRWARRDKLGVWPINSQMAGLDNSVIPWLKKRDIAVLGWETAGYQPKPEGDMRGNPVHDFALTMLGIHILDRADFTKLAEAAAARNRWEFLVSIAPLAIPNGTGSPVNPLAIF